MGRIHNSCTLFRAGAAMRGTLNPAEESVQLFQKPGLSTDQGGIEPAEGGVVEKWWLAAPLLRQESNSGSQPARAATFHENHPTIMNGTVR